MAKAAYVGVGGKARLCKAIYVGVGGVARTITKAYVGFGGKARLFYSTESMLPYYGTATPLDLARNCLAAATGASYAVFAGGSGVADTVDAYTVTLTHLSPAKPLSVARERLAGASLNGQVYFGGGRNSSANLTTVDAYTGGLTRTTLSSLQSPRCSLAAASNDNYVIFGGGYAGSNAYASVVSNAVDAYNTSNTKVSATSLSLARAKPAATSVGKFALFCGGENSGPCANVDAYNASLTRVLPSNLGVARYSLAAASLKNYAVFGGGTVGGFVSSPVVEVYDQSLTRTTIPSLGVARRELSATAFDQTSSSSAPPAGSLEKYVLFAGGCGDSYSAAVDCYDSSFTRSSLTSLSVARANLAATSLDAYALFAGGGNSNGGLATVDVYQYYESQWAS